MKSMDELYEIMTQPNYSLIEDMKKIDDDILILGGGGKVGAAIAITAKRAYLKAGLSHRVVVASKFDYPDAMQRMQAAGVETIEIDLFDEAQLRTLPQMKNMIFMAGKKFGTSDNMSLTWAVNVILPSIVAKVFPNSHIVVFSTGNVYGYRKINSGGAIETEPLCPVGEYAQTCVGRERVMYYYSQLNDTPMFFFRLNYAIDMQYGVLHDIAQSIMDHRPIDLSAGYFNCIWQGDAAALALRSLLHCQTPPAVYNITGPEAIPIRWVAQQLGRRLDIEPTFIGLEPDDSLFSNASKAIHLFGYPATTLGQMLDWTADWCLNHGAVITAPTHFQERSGQY